VSERDPNQPDAEPDPGDDENGEEPQPEEK
jgi:hypothetical protein